MKLVASNGAEETTDLITVTQNSTPYFVHRAVNSKTNSENFHTKNFLSPFHPLNRRLLTDERGVE